MFLAHAGFQLLMLVMMIAMFSAILFADPGRGSGPPRAFFWIMIAFFTVFYLLFTIPSIIAAYGLRNHKGWARIASIIAGVIAAMNMPIGTAACVYALWFFLGDNWKDVYEAPVKGGLTAPAEFDTSKWQGSFETDQSGKTVFTPAQAPDWR